MCWFVIRLCVFWFYIWFYGWCWLIGNVGFEVGDRWIFVKDKKINIIIKWMFEFVFIDF